MMMTRLSLFLSSLSVVLVSAIAASPVHAGPKEEEALREGCTWLDRALVREPDRDDAFGMFMRGLMPKCHALLEALARGDKSVRADGLKAVVTEISELQSVIDSEHGGPPPATGKPTPDEVAKKKVADERAGVDAEKTREQDEKNRLAEEQKRLEAEKKAAEEATKQAEKEAKERADAEKREAERRAKETDRERKAREAAEKKAAQEAEKLAKQEASRLKKEQQEAEKRAADEAKKAEQEAKKEAKEREAAEKKAADEARKEAETRAKTQALEEAEARRLIEEAEREAVEAERRAAREKAAALVDAELATADDEARAERERLAAENAKRVANEKAAREAGTPAKVTPTKQPRVAGKLDGTWEQPASKNLDRTMKRTLNIFLRDGKVQGELLEEVWFPAPMAWVDRSCEGNPTFRMVTSARVSGEAGKTKLVLWRDVPRVLTCTCPSRCTVETRRRGFDLAIGPNGAELSDSSGVFVRPGTVIVGTKGEVALEKTTENAAPVVEVTSKSFVGVWETQPFKSRDQTLVRRLELKQEGDKFVGTLVERSSQGLPLQSWSERFCGGAPKWEWVTQWLVDGTAKGTGLSLRGQKGDTLTCSCPSKCTKPKDKMSFKGELGTTGESLTIDGELYEKK